MVSPRATTNVCGAYLKDGLKRAFTDRDTAVLRLDSVEEKVLVWPDVNLPLCAHMDSVPVHIHLAAESV